MEPFPPPTEQDEEEEEEEEEDWLRPQPAGHSKSALARSAAHRVIVHVDLDCFYAQVEMLRNPELRDKPLGVQQKNLVVTSNYEARKLGVQKLMFVKVAKEKCPQLVLVNGEDLTPYREMSYKVTGSCGVTQKPDIMSCIRIILGHLFLLELLGEFCPLVERLGLDENFVDVTEMVEKRVKQLQQSACSRVSVSGHVYNNQAINLDDTRHVRLILGSQIAEELREAVYTRLGLTGCAGVAANKLLAKLASGTFKPNQQTVLLPESRPDLIRSLDRIQKVPGIGSKTAKRLEALGIKNVCDLQAFPSAALEAELGAAVAQRIQKLSYGEDESPVTPWGPPQSFSDEDSFKKCSTEVEVKEKIEELLHNLLDRIRKDGRQPHTVRLTIRQFSSTDKWFNRESRQCPIPPHLIQQFGKESSDILSPLVDILLKLFRKMIDVHLPFHLTLLSICFSNLKALPRGKKGSIGFYLKQMSPPAGSAKRPREVEDVSQEEGNASWNQNYNRTGTTKSRKLPEEKQSQLKEAGIPHCPFHLPPGDIDPQVFRELPEDIHQEMIAEKAEAMASCSSQCPTSALDKQKLEEKTSQQAGIVFPPHVDTKTFYELPADVQEELIAEWKNQGPVSKTVDKPPEKPKASKGRRNAAPCLSQSNSLLRYFKPR
ncbi:DNA polymerase iota-like isoform X2 [Patagioenas fasciata]|uniref:DNA polymerase iota-like isoform X2 n=1 Tax=Patagioenas fasciata TaxID=372321 RepID=UPI003A98FA26